MADNPADRPPREVAQRLEQIAADLEGLEDSLPEPLTLATARRELLTTATACRRLETASSDTETREDTTKR
ncbi:hypothetical protein [Natrononativus amylolyticus]|uniref:hypothetical protein n=1 Tax=Natrononativus amylolyticus TaxID=2963434 RepID=UPI0020CDD174|nr:hypothetical protein [Natrononativus amylolyticus]